MTTTRFLLLVLGLGTTSAALCGFYPQSYLDGNPRTKTDTQLYAVRIVSVDRVTQRENPVSVTPGPHWLEVQIGPADGIDSRQASKPQIYVLKIKPCTRYFLAAHSDSPLRDKWKLVVDAEEAVKACDPANELKKFPDPSLPDAPKTHQP